MKNDQSEHYHIDSEVKEVIIRHGDALAPQAEKGISIDGTLSSPFQFLSGRGTIDETKSHLRIYKDLGKVELYIQDTNPYTTHKITGSLKRDSVLNQFAINTEKRWAVSDFLKFVRTMRFYFADKEQHSSLLQSLQTWSVQIQRVIKEHNDNSGNSNFQLETKVRDVKLLTKFALELPIFQGYPKHKFNVEIGLDPKAVSVDLYLISDELIELEIGVREKTIENELKNFEANKFAKVIVS